MNEFEILIDIIKNLVNNAKSNIFYDEFDYEKLYNLAKHHSLENMLFFAYNHEMIKISEKQAQELIKINKNAIYKSVTQDVELNLISKTFEENKIKHLILKGSIIKNLYPSLDFRSMADIDILVLKEDLLNVKKLMLDIGYVVNSACGNHDVYYKMPFMNIEIHRNMIDDSYKLSSYYKSIWDRLSLNEDKLFSYKQSDEDFYIYLISHAAKHFGNGGIGIRTIMDIYVFLKHKPNIDFKYINDEFDKLGIRLFNEKLMQLAFIWFGEAKSNEEFDLLGNYIINSGTYGTTAHSFILSELEIDKDINNISKMKLVLKRAFPPYKTMKKTFPSLRHLPFLLPFYYLIRIIKAFFTKNKEVRGQVKTISSINNKEVIKIKKVKDIVGFNEKQ